MCHVCQVLNKLVPLFRIVLQGVCLGEDGTNEVHHLRLVTSKEYKLRVCRKNDLRGRHGALTISIELINSTLVHVKLIDSRV